MTRGPHPQPLSRGIGRGVSTADSLAVVCLAALALSVLLPGSSARADGGLPPWSEPGDLPVPTWARSVVPLKDDQPLQAKPDVAATRRGSVIYGARLPLYGARRGPGCEGRWLLVGPYAWICADAAELTGEEPTPSRGALPLGWSTVLPPAVVGEGLPYRYYFVGKEGASGFHDLAHADEEAPDQDYEGGFAVAVVEERDAHGERWGRTRHGEWIALRELGAARPAAFKGERVESGSLDFAWVGIDKASVVSAASSGKAKESRFHLEVVRWREEKATPGGTMVRVSEEGAPEAWMRAKDLVRPAVAPPPEEVGGAATEERWLDIDLATQTLVAYDGTRPVYATLVSSGKGAAGTDTATPKGVHRIWVKLLSTNMGNLQNEDADEHYLIEDVPYVQFFDKAVALHGAFWHRAFGHVHSHGCVNLAPADAEWLFAFTSPHVPAGWSAALPSPVENGTAVRVR
jgi:lipoprotein-anchoring transpeptidase ErfK/SrfK